MIVILNTLALSLSYRIAEHLSCLYEDDGVFVDLHASPDSQSLERMASLIPPETIMKHVEMEKRNGIGYLQNTDRRFFRKGTPRSHHIHIVAHDSPSARASLCFRDALRSDAGLRQEYQQLKQDAMQRFKY